MQQAFDELLLAFDDLKNCIKKELVITADFIKSKISEKL